MKKEIKAVIFDIGGVLHLPAYTPLIMKKRKKMVGVHEVSGVHVMLAKRFKVSVDTWFDTIEPYYSKSTEGKISKKDLLNGMSISLKIPPKKLEKILFAAYRKKYKINKDLHKFALKIKKQGYKIALLSDQWQISAEALIGKSFKKNFDAVVISSEAGVRKPNISAYKLTLKRLKTKPRETIFIDNRERNLRPARKLGINTILYKNNKQLFKELKKWGIK